MPTTVPNQKTIHINREKPEKNFLQIKKENWYAANKELTPYGLQLYLYLAGNKDGFDLALSQEAAFNEAGIKKTTFHKYVQLFIEKGYLVQRQGNIYDFYETPQLNKDTKASPCDEQSNLQNEQVFSESEESNSSSNKEIDKIDSINNINNKDTIQETEKPRYEFIF